MTNDAVIKKILLPTDLNPEIPESISYAVALSRWTKADLYILITYRLIEDEHRNQSHGRSIRDYLNDQAMTKAQLIRDIYPQECLTRCHFLVEIGFLSERIRSNVQKFNIDLVIMNEEMEKLLDISTERNRSGFFVDLPCPVMYIPANKIAV